MRLADLSLRDQVAIVTGGSQGIGRAISLAFARHGASVCVADVDPQAGEDVANEIRRSGGESLVVPVDVTNEAQVAAMADKAAARFGRVDILVNNAGGASGPGFGIGRTLNISAKDWDDTLAVNLKSVFLCTRAIAPGMLARGRGSIVNTASITGEYPWAGLPAYSAAKAAVINYTKSLAMELAPHVRVNAIAPGLVETPRTSKNRRPEQRDQLLTNVALARMGTPEEIADIVVYLASDVAAWITGTVVDCNGGQAWMTVDGRPKFRDERV
jgi:NAD(P)-dependent dehydrogenase (short-subunit alcohol dehydrogenase family)